MIIYQVWTGMKPWDGLQTAEIETKVLANERPEIPEIHDEKKQALINQCWQESHILRPNFSEIVEILTKKGQEEGSDNKG